MILTGMARAAVSYQGFYRTTSVVRLDYLLIIYSYFMTTKETVKLLSQLVEKLYSGIMVDCSTSSREITVLLPNCLKTAHFWQQYADACP